MTTPDPAAPPPAGPSVLDHAESSAGPLGELALSFSGGGYRAAGFHLGSLRLLERVGLLPSVVALSTVSGGSIVGAAWALSVARRRPFSEFDGAFTTFLQSTNVIRDALHLLTERRPRGGPAYTSLIRSAAAVYARSELFGDHRLADLEVGGGAPAGDGLPAFREVIVNSTEFRTAGDFRFRRSTNPRARAGSAALPLPKEVAGRVRLADAVAASSCFPGGFEPILFPDHFAWPADFPLDAVRGALSGGFEGGVALMDGGVWDNQGVESLVLAFQRSEAATLVISDVSARQTDIYDFPPPAKRGWLTLRRVAILGWVLFVAAVVSAVLLLVTGLDEVREASRRPAGVFFLYAVPFLFSAAVAAALVWVRLRVGDAVRILRSEVHIGRAWKEVRRLTVLEVIALVQLRVTSLLALTSSIFMKRIRGLVFRGVYHDPAFEGRRMASLIYSLDENRPRLYGEHPWLEPSPSLRGLARWAEAFPTTLWFDDADQLKWLATAGEATLCFILLKFIVEKRAAELERPGSPLAPLFATLRAEWDRFQRITDVPAVPVQPPTP